MFSVWAVYDHPKDYPDNFVARKWTVEIIKRDPVSPEYKEVQTDEIIVATTRAEITKSMIKKQLICLAPMIGDDPVIIETWI